MKSALSFRNAILPCLLAVSFLLPGFVRAQCPSVMGTGDPAVILVNLYGMPYGHAFSIEDADYAFGLTGGIQIGAILKPSFQLVSGVEMTQVRREVEGAAGLDSYRTFLMEIPLDMRMRVYDGRNDEGYFILGLGAMFSNVRETNDPFVTRDQMLYHQFFLRVGFEHAITVKKTFNVLWGLLGKAAPLAVVGEEYSFLNGSYYAGLKLGFQFGF